MYEPRSVDSANRLGLPSSLDRPKTSPRTPATRLGEPRRPEAAQREALERATEHRRAECPREPERHERQRGAQPE
jgi:hypothetical protein